MFRFSIIIAALFLNFVYGYTQYTPQRFFHLTRNDGLSQSTVNCILKDSKGFFWFGSNDGINRYDGYSFYVYRHSKTDSTSLGLGRIVEIYEDSRYNLWIGTDQGGLNLFNRELNNFTRFETNTNESGSILNNNVRAITEDSFGKLLIGTYGRGVFRFDPDTRKFTPIPLIRSDSTIDQLFVSDILVDSEGIIWIGTTTGVFALNKNNQNYFNNIQILQPEKVIISIYQDKEGLIWFGTHGNDVFTYDKKTGTTEYLKSDESGKGVITNSIVRSFVEDQNGNLWIGTGGGGINILNKSRNHFSYLNHKMNNQHTLYSNIIYSLYKDNDDNIWVGTYNGGINIYHDYKSQFNHIKGFGSPNSLTNNAILDLEEDRKGNIWIGTDGGGLNVFNPETGIISALRFDPNNRNSISGDVITAVHITRSGQVWIGTFTKGVCVYDPATNQFRHFMNSPDDLQSLSSNNVWDIIEDQDGDIWLATLGGGICRFNKKDQNFTSFTRNSNNPNSLSDENTSVLYEDRQGIIWIGTEFGGINKLIDKKTGVIIDYQIQDDQDSSLSSNHVRAFLEDSEGNFWVGTHDGGLNLFDREKETFINYTTEDGLPNNTIYTILEDDNGHIWISTNYGICKFKNAIYSPYKPDFSYYNENDGLQSNEFSHHAGLKTRKGVLYFGGINGFNYFHPDSISENKKPPEVVLTDFKIFNKSVEISPASPLTKHISFTDQITIDFKQWVLTFEYAALDYTVPEKNTYRYMLEPLDNDWNEAGDKRSITYTNLNPGEYTFRVTAANNDGLWNSDGASVKLIVKPPFYRTTWFAACMTVIFFLILFLIYRLRVYSLNAQRRLLKSMVDERTVELREMNKSLEEKNIEIGKQSEEMTRQQKDLLKVNKKLKENQERIENQNQELEKHRNNLEDLVAERTIELEEAKLKAEDSERLKMAFLSNMSHEIRTPMNAIMGFASLLGDEDLNNEEREDYIKQVNTNGESLLVLIDDILDLSKIEANQLVIKDEVFELESFIRDIYNSWAYMDKISKSDLEFKFNNKLEGRTVFLKYDKHRIKQIIYNLLDNAFKFTSKGKVILELLATNNSLEIIVQDTGIGIPKDSINLIFDRFRKGIDTGTKIYRGAGLGLTISRKLAELLGGELSVDSKPGKGSRFILKLPNNGASLEKKPVKKIESGSTDDIDFTGKKILVVEDEKNNFLFLKGLLSKRRAEISWAKNGLEAVEMTESNSYDIVLMDIKMPVMSGIEATIIIKKKNPDLPVIAQTAFARPEEEAMIRKAKFNDYIAKPLKKNALLRMIEEHIRNEKHKVK